MEEDALPRNEGVLKKTMYSLYIELLDQPVLPELYSAGVPAQGWAGLIKCKLYFEQHFHM